MNFEDYIDDIANLIRINIDRRCSLMLINPVKCYMYENTFELTLEEYQLLKNIISEISLEYNLNDKFSNNFIFDKFVREIIIKSYTLDSSNQEIKSKLRTNFQLFVELLNEELKDWTHFIPISGIYVENKMDFGSMSIYPFWLFKKEFCDNLKSNCNQLSEMDNYILTDELKDSERFCFVKLTVNGTEETSRDKALSKVNGLLSVFSLYKPQYINGFGIMGDVLPLNSEIVYYSSSKTNFNICHKSTVNNRSFNLTEHAEHMRKFHLDFFIELIHKNHLSYVENKLLNSIQWYYESVKIETDFKEDVAEVTIPSREYYEHYSYFKLGTKLIYLITSLESLLLFRKSVDDPIKKIRFNKIMNFGTSKTINYYKHLKKLYKLRNDITHSNKKYGLLDFNVVDNTWLINSFIFSFVKLKIAFDESPDRCLETKNDLAKFYLGENILN